MWLELKATSIKRNKQIVLFADNNLVMKALNGSEEVCKYEKKALPESDKANAYLVTKSEEDGLRFL